MPDQFVALGYVDGDRVFEAVGAPVPDTLITGPDPAAATDPDDTLVNAGMKWIVDFDEAVAVGMAMRIPLPADAQSGVDELVVLGLRTSADSGQGAQIAETLVRAHLYSSGGFSFVPQGTETNDIGPDGPAGTAHDVDEAYLRAFRPAPPTAFGDWRDKTDGRHFAEALGIDPQIVRRAANSGGFDQADAHAMNVALWPATMGPYLEEMMSPLLDLGTIRTTQRFFTDHVSGRGPVPAIRVGDQPYGVAVTTAISRWKPERVSRPLGLSGMVDDLFRKGLHSLLMRLDGVWADLAGDVAVIGEGTDPQAVLLEVMGLQPRSAEYRQRFAVALDQLANAQNVMGASSLSSALLKLGQAGAQQVLDALGITASDTPEIYRRIFFDSAAKLTGPFVDGAPLSTTAPLPALSEDGENYLRWLADSDIDTIRRHDFGRRNGAAIAPPTALLYLLLNQAVQNAFLDTSWNFYDSAGLGIPLRRTDPWIMNVQTEPQPPSRYDLLYRDSSLLTETHPDVFSAGASVASILSNDALIRSHPFSAELSAVRQACDWLAGRPTGSLALTAAEHIDLCSYHLPAWQLGLANERLRTLRGAVPYARGLYVGAFGYLEKLAPKPPSQPYGGPIPAGLEPAQESQPTMVQAGAEHILAPSLNHAVTAAVLRNAYLTHSDPGRAKTMSIDISSKRVRGALDLLDGVRAGQGLAELLGYAFERDLHDSYQLAEVDKFIYPLRAKFPLASGHNVPTPPGTPIQAVEARNVLNGHLLVLHMQANAKLNYPFGYPDLPPAKPDEALAIDKAAAHLIDMLDSVADLMLAESAYSAALGNFERAGAALDSISGAATVPDPEILRTRRAGHGVTHRLCLVFPGQPGGGEHGSEYASRRPFSPRAQMEPGLNAWLGQLFGDLEKVACLATWSGEGGEAGCEVTLADLFIEPIDLLYIAEPAAESGAGEFDLRIALAARRIASLDGDVAIKIAYSTDLPNRTSLFQLLPLIRAAKGLCLGRRCLGASDFAPPAAAAQEAGAGGAKPRPADANRWQVAAFRAQVHAAADLLAGLNDGLEAIAALLQGAPDASYHLWARALLVIAAGYGIPGALPPSLSEASEADAAALIADVARAAAALADRSAAFELLKSAPVGLDEDGEVAHWTAAAKAIFGRDFIAMPSFLFGSPGDIEKGIHDRGELVRHAAENDPFPLETWLAGLARVSEAPAQLERILILTQALRRPEPELIPLQLPYRKGDHWLGMELPDGYTFGPDCILATTIFAAKPRAEAPQAGLLLAEWTEIIPAKDRTAAVTFRFDAPASEPPQSLLLAVTPEITGAWDWDDLVETVRETIRMARNRTVEPRLIDRSAFAQLLPAIMVPFTATGLMPGTQLLSDSPASNAS